MSQLPPTDGMIQVEPQSNIYTLMMIITILVLCVTVGLVMHKLMSADGYGMTFSEFLSPIKTPQ